MIKSQVNNYRYNKNSSQSDKATDINSILDRDQNSTKIDGSNCLESVPDDCQVVINSFESKDTTDIKSIINNNYIIIFKFIHLVRFFTII